MLINKIKTINENENTLHIIDKDADLSILKLNEHIVNFIKKEIDNENTKIQLNLYTHFIYVYIKEDSDESYKINEKARKAGAEFCKMLNKSKSENIVIQDHTGNKELPLSLTEGIALANYQFRKYLTDKKKKPNSLNNIKILADSVSEKDCMMLNNNIKAVYYTRDLVNEPQSYLNSVVLAEEIQKLGKEAGFETMVFNKEDIEEHKMGGLLAVNKGSITPPTFSIMKWLPENAKNQKPIVLVGKGIVYDTGGLSLKPTANSMDTMKSDMAGAAAVIGAMYAIAANKIPLNVIALIPATDNRPDGNAYAPGDVITMMNGMTVEVLNTDAEGRMVLADALTYADRLKPELVIDLATLTGSAERAVGQIAICGMGNAKREELDNLIKAGYETYERIVEFPFWEEYGEMMKSDIADLKNLGGANAGMITAGKFLENFTKSPFIHLDIAGPSFLSKDEAYITKGGSGNGARLIYSFLANKADNL